MLNQKSISLTSHFLPLTSYLELCHLDSNDGTFVSLVSVFTSSTVLSLLEIVGGKQAKYYGYVIGSI